MLDYTNITDISAEKRDGERTSFEHENFVHRPPTPCCLQCGAGVEPSKHFGEVWYFVPGTDEIHVCGLTPSAMMRKAIREQGGPR